MGALDDLLTEPEEKRSALDMLIGEPAPKAPAPPLREVQGLDALLAETEQPRPAPTLIPSAENPISLEQSAEEIQKQRQGNQRELLRAASQIDSEVLANKVKSGQPLTEVERTAWQEQSGQAIPTRELENTAILAAGAFAPMAAVGVNTLGRVGGTALGEGLLGAGINVGLDTGEALSQGRLPDLTEMAKNAATGAVAGAAGGALGGLFSGKIKDVAKFRGTTPQQINKELQQAAKATGVTRGEALDEMIYQSVQTPEGAQAFAKYLDQAAEEPDGAKYFREYLADSAEPAVKQGIPPQAIPEPAIPAAKISDLGIPNLEGKVTRETAETILSPNPVADQRFDQYGNRITGKTVNLSKLVPDDAALQQQIDNMVNTFPEDAVNNVRVSNEYLRSQAELMPGSALDDFYRKGFDSQLPANELRNITYKRIAAEDLFQNHATEVTAKLAKEVKAGNMDKLADFTRALEVDIKLARETGALRSEYGRGFQALRMKAQGADVSTRFTQDVAKLLNRIKHTGDAQDIARRMSMIDIMDPRQRLNFMRGLVQPSNWDRVTELWYNSTLSGPVTQIRNILGNVGAAIYREAEKPITGGIDLVRSTVARSPREAFIRESLAGFTGQTGRQFIRNPIEGLYGFMGGIADGAKAGYKSFVSEIPQYADVSINELVGNQKFMGGAIKGTKGRVIRVPSRVMMGIDEFFKAVHDRIGINSLAYRKARQIAAKENLNPEAFNDLFMKLKSAPDDEIMRMAREETLYRVFQKDPGRIVNQFLAFKNSHPLINLQFPFIRTPVNIGMFTAERLPGVNLAFLISNARKGSVLKIEESLAKMATGGLTALAVWQMFQNGLIRGQGVDPRKRGQVKGLQTAGEQRYSFVIGDKSISFMNFTPISGLLGFMTDGYEAMERFPIMSDDFFGSLTASFMDQVGIQSYMQNWDVIMNDIGEGNYGKGAARLMAMEGAGLIPYSSLLRSVGIGLDPTMRTPFENQGFAGKLADYFMLNIPGLRKNVMPVMDVWGNDVVTPQGAMARVLESQGIDPGPIGQVADVMSNPFRIEELSSDPVNVELARLIHTMGPAQKFAGLDSPRIKGSALENINVTQEEYIAFVKESGKRAHDAIATDIKKSWYMRMPDKEKIKLYEHAIKQSRADVKDEMFGERLNAYKYSQQ